MRRFLAAAVVVASLGASSDAFAQSEHFVREPTARCQGADLLVTFKVAGLGQGESVVVTADGSATARCINRGDNIPPGQTEDVMGEGTFGPASRSGTITGTLPLSVDHECPGNQRLQVTYEDIFLQIAGDEVALDGTFVCGG